jgi:hypothetical protein
LRWVPQLGVLGVATGAIAIGTAATSTSTTTIILTETTTRMSTGVRLARATGGSTTRNTGEMRPMGIGKRRINSAARGLAARAVGSRGLEPELAPVAAPELAPVQVAVQVQAPVLVQGVAELEHARAEAARERGLVVAELELVRAEAARVLGLQRDQLAVPRRTRSATEAHHRDLARLLAAEDLAAVVETTRDPAATEAATAWAAAG